MTDLDVSVINVTIAVKTCSIEHITHPLLKRYIAAEYTDLIVVRDVAGIVTKVGSDVKRFKPGDEVIGLLPVSHYYDVTHSECTLLEYYLVKKPASLTWEVASCCLMDGIRAYNALHYLGRLIPQETLLICNAASPFGVLTIQLARNWNIKVFMTTANEEEAQLMRTLSLDVERMFSGHQFLKTSILDESGGLGIDCIVDNGVLLNHKSPEDCDWTKPTKHDIISCLAMSGRWVSHQQDLQIDPPDSEVLHYKNASLAQAFPDSYLLSAYRQNRVLSVLDDVLAKADAGILNAIAFGDLLSGLHLVREDKQPKHSNLIFDYILEEAENPSSLSQPTAVTSIV